MTNLSNTWIFDIECRMSRLQKANFYQKAEEFLCLVAQNPITKEVKLFTPDMVEDMMVFLSSVDYLVGHNIKLFDIPALGHMFPQYKTSLYNINLIDTRFMAWKEEVRSPDGLFTYGQMKNFDKAHGHPVTKQLNSLKSWGYRMGMNKLDTYADYTDDDWANLSLTDALIEYCKTDVALNTKLFLYLLKKKGIKYELCK